MFNLGSALFVRAVFGRARTVWRGMFRRYWKLKYNEGAPKFGVRITRPIRAEAYLGPKSLSLNASS